MSDYISRWRCPECYGTGRVAILGHAATCYKCDGTSNGFAIDKARRHARVLAEIDERFKGESAHKPVQGK